MSHAEKQTQTHNLTQETAKNRLMSHSEKLTETMRLFADCQPDYRLSLIMRLYSTLASVKGRA